MSGRHHSGHLRIRLISAATVTGVLGALGTFALAPAAHASPVVTACGDGSVQASDFSPGSVGSYAVPTGVSNVQVVATGGSGADQIGTGDDPSDGKGGQAAVVTGALAVTAGHTLSVAPGSAGSGATPGTSGGSASGGAGGSDTVDPNNTVTVGGGGGASFVSDSGTVLVAAAGGGGAGYPVNGGNAAANGGEQTAGSVTTGGKGDDASDGKDFGGAGATSSPGAGGTGDTADGGGDGADGSGEVGGAGGGPAFGGAGGGGGGYAGGGGGGGGPAAGGGGAGSSYSVGAYSVSGSTGDGSVAISYQCPAISSDDTALFTVDEMGSFTVTTNAVPAASIGEVGTLPNGLMYVDNGDGTATISGTPGLGTGGDDIPVTLDAGNGDGTDATQQLSVEVQPQAPNVTVTPSDNNPTHGESEMLTTTLGELDPSDPPTGSVSLTNNGTAIGSCTNLSVAQVSGVPTASCSTTALPTGPDDIEATFTSTNDDYSAATGDLNLSVSKDATTTTVSVQPHQLTATVVANPPGSGSPTGTVQFSVSGTSVGSAPVTGGAATLSYTTPTGHSHSVAAAYGGDANFTGSSDSTTRNDPTITAHVHSAKKKTTYGWYSQPVTVSFKCASHGAALTAPCPGPKTLSHNGAALSVTRTIMATNGGAATVVVSPINVDKSPPKVRIAGVHGGASYPGTAPKAKCVATDTLSGIVHCTLKVTTHGSSTDVVAKATNKAGLATTARLSYQVLNPFVVGAAYHDGAFTTPPGSNYTVEAISKAQPKYVYAAPATTTHPHNVPAGAGPQLTKVGKHRWALTISVTKAMAIRYKLWNIGVRFGGAVHVVEIHLTG